MAASRFGVRTDPEPFDDSGPLFVYDTRVASAPSGELRDATLTLHRCTTDL